MAFFNCAHLFLRVLSPSFRLRGLNAPLKVVVTAAILGSLTLAWAPSSAAPSSSPDILGVKIGMSPQEVGATLKATGIFATMAPSKAKISFPSPKGGVEYLPTPVVAAILADSPDASPNGDHDSVRVLFGGPPGSERAIMIERTSDYSPAKRPLYSNLISALHERYGKPSAGGAAPRQQQLEIDDFLAWGYGLQGLKDRFDSQSFSQYCSVPMSRNFDWSTLALQGDARLLVPFAAACGEVVAYAHSIRFAAPFRDQNTLVSRLRMKIVGAALTQQLADSTKEAIRAAQSRTQEETKRDAASNKPRL